MREVGRWSPGDGREFPGVRVRSGGGRVNASGSNMIGVGFVWQRIVLIVSLSNGRWLKLGLAIVVEILWPLRRGEIRPQR